MVTFNDKELGTLDAACMIAAEVYEADAKTMRVANQPRLEKQFTEQAKECRRLAERIATR